MDNTTNQLEQRLAQLPEDVRNAVLSAEWEGKIQAIGAKHRLHIDQIGTLGDVTLMAMLGMFDLTEYPSRLVSEIKVSVADADAITKEVGDEVFMPIRESLKKLSVKPSESVTPQATAPAASPAPAAAVAPTPTPGPAAPMAPASAGVPPPQTIIGADFVPAKPAAPKPDLSAAEAVLSATSVTTVAPTAPAPAAPSPAQAPAATAQPPKPTNYATDPYREPPV